jgi:hypothetical protein
MYISKANMMAIKSRLTKPWWRANNGQCKRKILARFYFKYPCAKISEVCPSIVVFDFVRRIRVEVELLPTQAMCSLCLKFSVTVWIQNKNNNDNNNCAWHGKSVRLMRNVLIFPSGRDGIQFLRLERRSCIPKSITWRIAIIWSLS